MSQRRRLNHEKIYKNLVMCGITTLLGKKIYKNLVRVGEGGGGGGGGEGGGGGGVAGKKIIHPCLKKKVERNGSKIK